jgi:hypothetical protein
LTKRFNRSGFGNERAAGAAAEFDQEPNLRWLLNFQQAIQAGSM